MKMTAVHQSTTPPKGEHSVGDTAGSGRTNFVSMALNMSWQLVVVVLIPIIAGAKLDKTLNTKGVCTYIGLGIALVGSAVVMWRAMQAANRLPVPKLSAAQKREIQKQYEEDDD